MPLDLLSDAILTADLPEEDLKAGDAAYEKLVRSMEEYGYVQPLVWNKATGNLVGGHQRLKILIAQGATEVDVVVVELTPEKEKAPNSVGA